MATSGMATRESKKEWWVTSLLFRDLGESGLAPASAKPTIRPMRPSHSTRGFYFDKTDSAYARQVRAHVGGQHFGGSVPPQVKRKENQNGIQMER